MNREDQKYTIIENYLKDKCTREEFDRVREILKEPQKHIGVHGVLHRNWDELDERDVNLSDEESIELKNTLYRIHHEINRKKGRWEADHGFRRIWNITIRIAAILLLPVMVASLWYFISSRKPYQLDNSFITINTPEGSKIKTELPDGTVVWQNSGSTIRYPRNFTRRNRQVILTGEAFFDVASDKLYPFFVKTGDLLVTVTGTRFNVSGYPSDAGTTVVLEEGDIMVEQTNGADAEKVRLVPGDLLEASQGKAMKLYHHTDVQKFVSWIDGKLIFRDDPLITILTRLERWYNVEIKVIDPKNRFSNLPFTMTIQHESLAQILEYLKHAAPLNIKEEKLALKDDGSFSRPRYVIKHKDYGRN